MHNNATHVVKGIASRIQISERAKSQAKWQRLDLRGPGSQPNLSATARLSKFVKKTWNSSAIGRYILRFTGESQQHFGPQSRAPHLWDRKDLMYHSLAISRDALETPSLHQLGTRNFRSHNLLSAYAKLGALEECIGYVFKDKMLGVEALKCTSAVLPLYYAGNSIKGMNNQRLALLGDRVLSLALCHGWYNSQRTPGEYNQSEQRAISRANLAKVAGRLNFDKKVVMPRSAAFSIGRDTIAEAFEAVIGAVYKDSGHNMESVIKVLEAAGMMENGKLKQKISEESILIPSTDLSIAGKPSAISNATLPSKADVQKQKLATSTSRASPRKLRMMRSLKEKKEKKRPKKDNLKEENTELFRLEKEKLATEAAVRQQLAQHLGRLEDSVDTKEPIAYTASISIDRIHLPMQSLARLEDAQLENNLVSGSLAILDPEKADNHVQVSAEEYDVLTPFQITDQKENYGRKYAKYAQYGRYLEQRKAEAQIYASSDNLTIHVIALGTHTRLSSISCFNRLAVFRILQGHMSFRRGGLASDKTSGPPTIAPWSPFVPTSGQRISWPDLSNTDGYNVVLEQAQAMTGQEEATTGQQPVTTGQQPITTVQQPVTTVQQPVTTVQQPVTTRQQQVSKRRSKLPEHQAYAPNAIEQMTEMEALLNVPDTGRNVLNPAINNRLSFRLEKANRSPQPTNPMVKELMAGKNPLKEPQEVARYASEVLQHTQKTIWRTEWSDSLAQLFVKPPDRKLLQKLAIRKVAFEAAYSYMLTPISFVLSLRASFLFAERRLYDMFPQTSHLTYATSETDSDDKSKDTVPISFAQQMYLNREETKAILPTSSPNNSGAPERPELQDRAHFARLLGFVNSQREKTNEKISHSDYYRLVAFSQVEDILLKFLKEREQAPATYLSLELKLRNMFLLGEPHIKLAEGIMQRYRKKKPLALATREEETQAQGRREVVPAKEETQAQSRREVAPAKEVSVGFRSLRGQPRSMRALQRPARQSISRPLYMRRKNEARSSGLSTAAPRTTENASYYSYTVDPYPGPMLRIQRTPSTSRIQNASVLRSSTKLSSTGLQAAGQSAGHRQPDQSSPLSHNSITESHGKTAVATPVQNAQGKIVTYTPSRRPSSFVARTNSERTGNFENDHEMRQGGEK